MIKTGNKTGLDKEWVNLIKEAKTIGLTVDEVRLFLKDNQK
ncbi:anti-repressor SinI family protein [Virgibacillus sp. FSP13]|nr:anti-repressor SinI family protein [Lentibacillus sp. Marseille-P4043]